VIDPKLYFFTISYNDLAVAAWSCLAVASKSGLTAHVQRQIGAKVLVGACSSFWSHQFISNVLEYIHVAIDGLSAY
jgi:hypothetical protein